MDVFEFERRSNEIYREAIELHQAGVAWREFFGRILGRPEGAISRLFPLPSDRSAFEATWTHARILELLDELRKTPAKADARRVITVRLPEELHVSLAAEAHERRTSVNRLCVAKLTRPLEVPTRSNLPARSSSPASPSGIERPRGDSHQV